VRARFKRMPIISFDVLEAKLTKPAKCKCGKMIKPDIWCVLLIPSDPLEPIKKVVGKVSGYVFHRKCYRKFLKNLISKPQ